MAFSEPVGQHRQAAPPAEPERGVAPVSLAEVSALLAGLNRQQRRAVTHGEGPLLVLAGPGTGKTEVITRRAAWLIATKRAQARQILALTFTHKAAFEMQARVDLLVPYGQADTAIHTFHAFGDRIVREHAFELGLPGDMRLLSRAEAILLLRDEIFTLGLDRYRPLGDPGRFLGALVDLFGRAKDEGVQPADFEAYVAGLTRRAAAGGEDAPALLDLAQGQAEIARAYARYQDLLVQRGLIDHADQVLLCLRLLRERAHVRRSLHERFRYLLVDEFQDTNPAQLELVLELTGAQRNVTVVGDDDQAIYAFRGAAVSNLRRFSSTHRDVRRVVLTRNYRSSQSIVAASQRLIRHNGPARLASLDGLDKTPVVHRRRRSPAPVRALAFPSRDAEADAVAHEVAGRVEAGARPRDFAVLVRTNSDADAFMRSLLAFGVPARSGASRSLYERPEARALLAFLRVVADPLAAVDLYALATAQPYSLGGRDLTSIMSLARRHRRPLWEVLLELDQQPGPQRLAAATRKGLRKLVADVSAAIELSHDRSVGEVLYDFLRRSGRLARLARGPEEGDDPSAAADIVRLFETIRGQARLLSDDRVPVLVPHLADLAGAGDEPDGDSPVIEDDVVAVLTIHRAKGLEFPVIFLCGLADGRFPARGRAAVLTLPAELRRPHDEVGEEDSLAEERRLCYVGMTRARDELVLTYALEGPGSRTSRRVSPFVAEALDVSAASLPPSLDQPRLVPPSPAPPAGVPRPSFDPGRELALSFSQLEDYFSCPERYRLRHVIGVPTPPHHALVYGSALHQAVAAFHLRQARNEQMTEEELLGVFATQWSAEGFLSRQHEESRYAAGQAALRRFRAAQLEEQAPPPIAIERPFAFSIGRDQIRGRMDRLDAGSQGTVITDYKSSDVREQPRADQKARESLQLQVYALAHEAETGKLPHQVRLHFLDSGVVGSSAPDRKRLDRAVERISRAADDIRAERFTAQPNPVGCGYCPYRSICPQSAA